MNIEPTTSVITGKTIEEFADTIILSLNKAEKYLKTAMSGYINAGQKLRIAKEELGHGEWIPLLERVGISRMTANRYIRLAEDIRILNMAKRNMMLHLTQSELLKMTKLEDIPFYEVAESEDPSEKLRELTAIEPLPPTPLAEVKKELQHTKQSLKKAEKKIVKLEEEIIRLKGNH
ncbi:MAG: DUF3102 domain-containing protein [Campylobacterota bacterium]|nr:DUF3102 domain-containing protein [Campylobacterota bacterium]